MSARARTTLAVIAAFGLLASPAARAADGKADGTITVNGTTTKLSYAYARAVKGFFDKTKEDIEVVLSDVPLEGKAVEDQFERMHMADAGKLHAFEITIGAEGKPISTAFRHDGFKKASPSGLSSEGLRPAGARDGRTPKNRDARLHPPSRAASDVRMASKASASSVIRPSMSSRSTSPSAPMPAGAARAAVSARHVWCSTACASARRSTRPPR